jgi:hypothetical protein
MTACTKTRLLGSSEETAGVVRWRVLAEACPDHMTLRRTKRIDTVFTP